MLFGQRNVVTYRYAGLDCHLILRNSRQGADSDPGMVGNLLIDQMTGAHIHQVPLPAALLQNFCCSSHVILYSQLLMAGNTNHGVKSWLLVHFTADIWRILLL